MGNNLWMPSDAKGYVGMTKEAAVKSGEGSGYKVVVMDMDDPNGMRAITAVLMMDRLTLTVEKGIVTQARVG